MSDHTLRNAIRAALHSAEVYQRRERFILTDLICAILPVSNKFTIVDGGARDAGADPRWRPYDRTRLRFYGFEVDPLECDRLNKTVSETGVESRYFPMGLWSKPDNLTFFETMESSASSLFPPNWALTDRWKLQDAQRMLFGRELLKVAKSYQTDVDSLDNWADRYGISDVDFIKINVQGAELEILKGAKKVLPWAVGVETEISFVESYKGRAFFSDIDPHLRSAGYSFFDFFGNHYIGRDTSPITSRHLPGLNGLWGQLIEGKAIYLRDPIDMQKRGVDVSWATSEKLFKLVSVAEIYYQIEFAIELLLWEGTESSRAVAEVGVQAYRDFMR